MECDLIIDNRPARRSERKAFNNALVNGYIGYNELDNFDYKYTDKNGYDAFKNTITRKYLRVPALQPGWNS